MAGGVIRCVPLRPPAKADIAICSSPEWTTNFVELEQSITSRTKMIVLNTRITLQERCFHARSCGTSVTFAFDITCFYSAMRYMTGSATCLLHELQF